MTTRTRPCEICGEMIDPERAEGLPDTRLCTEHAREIAEFGGEFRISSEQERTSKVGSLKRNYGGIAVHKARNTRALEQLPDAYESRQFDESPE